MQGGSAAAAAAAAAASAAAAAAAAAFQGIRPPQFPEPEHQQLKCPRCDSTNTKFCYYNNYNLSQPRHFCKSCRRYWTKGGALRNIPVGGGTRKNSKRSNGTTKNGATNDDSNSNNGNASADASARTSGSNPSKRANNNNSNPLADPTTPTLTPTAPAPTALSSSSDPPAGLPKPELLPPLYPSGEQDRPMFEVGGTFSSLLSSTHHFGGLMGIPSLNSSHLDLGGPIGSTTLADLLPAGNGCDDAAATAPATAVEEDFLSLQGDPGCWNTGADRGGGDGGAGVRGGGWPGLSIYNRDADFH